MAHQSDQINTKNHWAIGIEWPVVGSKGDIYTVEMTNYGWECDCIARVKCKHIKSVESNFLGVDIPKHSPYNS